jgi:hypothetical protein
MQVRDSERCQHALAAACAALRRIHRHRCRAGENVVRSRVERRHVSGRTRYTRQRAPHLPARRPQLLAGQPIIAVTLSKSACLIKTCKLCKEVAEYVACGLDLLVLMPEVRSLRQLELLSEHVLPECRH